MMRYVRKMVFGSLSLDYIDEKSFGECIERRSLRDDRCETIQFTTAKAKSPESMV